MHTDNEEEFLEENDSEEKMHVSYGWFFTKSFLSQILLLSCVPIPYFDMYFTYKDSAPDSSDEIEYTYLLSDFLLTLMIIRIAFLFKAIMKYNIYNNSSVPSLQRAKMA